MSMDFKQKARADRPARCPICKAATATAHKPFCSKVCRDRDLLKWLGEDYRVPVAPEEEPAGERES
ncbi:MAG: DNA gyrase inhibitor YacG [Pacificimonas sp.]